MDKEETQKNGSAYARGSIPSLNPEERESTPKNGEESKDEFAEEAPGEETGTEEKPEKKETEKKSEEETPKVPEERKRERRERSRYDKDFDISKWIPKTKLGKEVKRGEITNIDDILKRNKKLLEPEIVDALIEVQSDLILIGQSKGKFGGGKRRAWRQTQRKTKEGNVPTFSTLAVVGDGKGHIGVGSGKAKETLPAREKSVRKAKLNLIEVKRTCSAFDCDCTELHTIPFKTQGKAGSVRVTLIPAPQGTGLVVANELKKVLSLAGIKDVYSQTFGKKRTTFNLVKACMDALEKTNKKAIGHTHRQEGRF